MGNFSELMKQTTKMRRELIQPTKNKHDIIFEALKAKYPFIWLTIDGYWHASKFIKDIPNYCIEKEKMTPQNLEIALEQGLINYDEYLMMLPYCN